MSWLDEQRLLPGYAETSTRRRPRCPETIVLSDEVVRRARCVGPAVIDGSSAWLAFKVPGERRYYFQYRPW
jgi:hypothetical protein